MREKKKPKKIRDKTVNDEQNETGNMRGKAAGRKKDFSSVADNIGRGGNKGGRECGNRGGRESCGRNSSRQTRNK